MVEEKEDSSGLIESLTATLTPLVPNCLRTASARPLPYSLWSSITATFFTARVSAMKSATPGPCTSSFASTRCQVFQPFAASDTAVADGETFGMPASSRIGTPVFDSPENAGPITPTTLSLMAFLAWLVACAGSPWVSYLISLTWVTPDLALCSCRASSTPLEMLIPSWALGPVWAPMKPRVASPPPPPPVPPPPPSSSSPPQAERRRARAAVAATRPWEYARRTSYLRGNRLWHADIRPGPAGRAMRAKIAHGHPPTSMGRQVVTQPRHAESPAGTRSGTLFPLRERSVTARSRR